MKRNINRDTLIVGVPYIIISKGDEILDPMYLTEERHVLGRNPQQADLVVPNDWNVIGRTQALIQKQGYEYYIYDGDGKKPSTNRLFLKNTLITPKEGHLLEDGMEIKIGQNPETWVTIIYSEPTALQTPINQPQKRFISLTERSVMLGRDPSATLRLEAPTVSRQHAIIDRNARGNYVIQDCSTNGVFLNGEKVNKTAIIPDGATIRIGPYTLILQGDKLFLADQGDNIRLDVDGIVRIVKNKRGENLTLLNDISLPIEPGQFVALVGGSGAGKSTLMRTLLGIDPTTRGIVYLNGEDLRNNFNIYRDRIGYVPQNDIVHKDLKVGEVLAYAARLRLPPDTDIEAVVGKTLEQIEMSDRWDVLVKKLSGGQLKRVSMGVELLADPKLFFLDEPTSGLDPGLDKKMMQLLRKLADEGRTVIMVTHATSNITLCDRIVFLGQGGNLCYFGPPKIAIDFFEINSGDFADIYIKLETEDETLKESYNFLNSDYYREYISDHLSIGGEQRIGKAPEKVERSPFKQLSILTERYLQLVFRDPVNLGLALLTAPMGISLITLAIGDKNPLILGPGNDPALAPLALRVLFVFTSAALWVGLSSSLQEIIKEADIYRRERLVNLGLFAYLGSKILVLGGLAFCQTILIAAVILIGFQSPTPELMPWSFGMSITSFLTLFTSMSLGLMVSSSVKNSSQANSSLPLLLIPQIIFSGVLFKMEGMGKYLSWLMLSRWSVGAYGALVDVNGLVPPPIIFVGGEIKPPFEGSPVYEPTWENLLLNWVVLLLHGIIYLGVAFWQQKRKDIF